MISGRPMSEWEGFEFEEEEEISYSFFDYLLAPIKFSAKLFIGIRQRPKLLYWISLLIIATLIALIPSYIQATKIEVEVVGKGMSEELIRSIKSFQEMFMKNPGFLGISIFLSSLIVQIIGAIVYFILGRVMGGRGSFSSHLMVVGMTSVPSIVQSLLEIPFMLRSPPTKFVIDLTEGGGHVGPSMVNPVLQVLSLVMALWSAAIIYYGARYTTKLESSKKAALLAALLYLIMIAPVILATVRI